MRSFTHALALALMGCGGGGGVGADAGVADIGGSFPQGGEVASDAGARPLWVPFVRGEFTRVYSPSGGRYLNDHTLARDDAGRWHVWGITHDSQGNPFAERSLLHATAPALEGPWTDEPDAIMAMAGEEVLWAPHVFRANPDAWTMYFYAGTADRRVQRAESADLRTWTRDARSAPPGRDPFVLRAGSEWLLYTVGVSAENRGQILVATSEDLREWSPQEVALEDPVPSFGWGNLESPTVVRYEGRWYLFVTRTSESPVDYARTVVFVSDDPRRFAWAPVTEMLTHAAEVFVHEGRWYITAAGWTSHVGERWRGLSVARLGWALPSGR